MAASPGGVPSSPAVIRNLHVDDQVGILCYHFTNDGEITVIGKSNFIEGFEGLKINFTKETLGDLFDKIHKHARSISEGLTGDDIARVKELYPTLFSVMVCRVLDKTMDSRQSEEVSREEIILIELESTFTSLKSAAETTTSNASILQNKSVAANIQLEAAESAVAAQRNLLQDAHSQTLDTKHELDSAMSTLKVKEHEHSEYCRSIGLDPFTDDVQNCKSRCQTSEAEVAAATDKIRQLKELLATLETDLQNREIKNKKFQQEYELADERLTEKLKECGSSRGSINNANDDVQSKERDLNLRQKEENLCGEMLQTALDSYKHLSDECISTQTDYNNIKSLLDQQQEELRLAEVSRDSQISKVAELKVANTSFNTLRDSNYSKEDELLTQEVRLKEQRDCLEMKEAQLRSQVVDMNPNLAAHIPSHLYTPVTSLATGSPMRNTHSPHPGLNFSGTPTPSPAKPAPLPGRVGSLY